MLVTERKEDSQVRWASKRNFGPFLGGLESILLAGHAVKEGLDVKDEAPAKVGVTPSPLKHDLRDNLLEKLEVVKARKQNAVSDSCSPRSFVARSKMGYSHTPCNMIIADKEQMLQNRQEVGVGRCALDHVPEKEEAAVEVVEIKLHVVEAVL